uniref:Envelope-like protein n=1 Tax=Cucumis melo TaxID=3656 RepID=A0A9I9EIK1_CUCME
EVSSKLPKQTVDSAYPAASGTHAPNISATPLSDMNSDDLDDVPLARLLKKATVSDVNIEMPMTPSVSVHSQKTSSTERVFVPTLGIHHTSNLQPGPSIHCPPSASLPFEPDVAHASIPGDVSTAPEGKTDANPLNPNIRSQEVPANTDDNPTVPPSSPKIPIAPKSAKQKSQQNRCNITIKTGRKKIPPNIPYVSIDGISFHKKENVQHWKFMVKQRITDEVNVSDKHQFCMSIMDLIERAVSTNAAPPIPDLILSKALPIASAHTTATDPTLLAIHSPIAILRSRRRLSFLVRRPTKPAATPHFSFNCYHHLRLSENSKAERGHDRRSENLRLGEYVDG